MSATSPTWHPLGTARECQGFGAHGSCQAVLSKVEVETRGLQWVQSGNPWKNEGIFKNFLWKMKEHVQKFFGNKECTSFKKAFGSKGPPG